MGSVAEGKGVPILRRSLILLVAVAVVALAGAVGPASAQTDPCPETNPTDISPCGPIYVLPQWSNTAGWDAGDPGDCSDGVTDELATKIVVIDSNDRLAGVSSKAAWKCRSPGPGLVRTLSLGN